MRKIFLLLIITIISIAGFTQDGFPVPANNPKQLFYLQRTSNTNTIVCEINYKKDGTIDWENPVHVFWIRYGEKGQRAELSGIQKKFAYGVKVKKINDSKTHYHII